MFAVHQAVGDVEYSVEGEVGCARSVRWANHLTYPQSQGNIRVRGRRGRGEGKSFNDSELKI